MDFLNKYSTPEIIVTIVTACAIPFLIYIFNKAKFNRDKRKLYKWVFENTSKRDFRSIKTIASKNHMTIEYAEKVLSSHKKLRRGLGTDKDIWTTAKPN